MDRAVFQIVKWEVARAGRSGAGRSAWHEGEPLRILLVGYNGARNTGADARVDALVAQLNRRFGDNVRLTVMTLDPGTTNRLFEGAKQLAFSDIFFEDLRRACNQTDLVLLCEGSTFKSTFADALSLFFCQAAGICAEQGKPCVSYGSEVGELDDVLRRAVAQLAGGVRFIARSQGSYRLAGKLGLKASMGTDTAWDFDSSRGSQEAERLLSDAGWDGCQPLLGVCPINPFWWPVKPSLGKWAKAVLTGDRSLQFSKMYFFSDSEERRRAYDDYLDVFAVEARRCADLLGAKIVIIGMERLDADACRRMDERLGGGNPVVLAADNDALVMAQVLQRLSMLVTSRYHAMVLSMAHPVPTVAFSMDERLLNLAQDIGLDQKLVVGVDDPDVASRLRQACDEAMGRGDRIVGLMESYRMRALAELEDMLDQLTAIADEYYPGFAGQVQRGRGCQNA